MRATRIKNRVSSIPIEKLVPHPDSPNRMSKVNFAKLVRNIERTGRYEPLVVRPCPGKDCHCCEGRNPGHSERRKARCFQIINGHNRCRALCELGYNSAEAVIWDLDDREADMLLAGINRLGGSDVLDKKVAVLKRLNRRMDAGEMARLLPLTATQIARLTDVVTQGLSRMKSRKVEFEIPVVFFVNGGQKEIIESALSLAREKSGGKTRAAKNAAALASIAECFNLRSGSRQDKNEDRVCAVGE